MWLALKLLCNLCMLSLPTFSVLSPSNSECIPVQEACLFVFIYLAYNQCLINDKDQCLVNELMMDSFFFQLYNAFPFLRVLPGSHNVIFKNYALQRSFILEKVKEHQESLDINNPRDFIDYFLIRMEKVQYNSDLLLYLCGCCDSLICFDFPGETEIWKQMLYPKVY